MKSLCSLIVTILLFNIGFTQTNSINYKALIKDSNGNIVANQSVNIQLTIIQKTKQVTKYQETHTVNTDANGIAIVNIGEGVVDLGIYENINWGISEHELNVKVDTGGGLTDMGTTTFNAVPYALYATTADNLSGLEYLDETNDATDNGGWRLIGRDPAYYGDIGDEAIDLSYSNGASATRGATGLYSVAQGPNTEASGSASTAMGNETIASGTASTAMGSLTVASGGVSTALGFNTEASGLYSVAMGSFTEASGGSSFAMGSSSIASGSSSISLGNNTKAESFASTAIGRYNVGGGNPGSWVSTDPLFEIGNGTSDGSRSNAFTVFKDGDATLAGALINISDRRLKIDITPLNYGLNEVLQLNPVSYYWKKDKETKTHKSIGLIAQEVDEVIKNVVTYNKVQDQYGVSYTELIPVLIKAIQEQQDIITTLKTIINDQKATVNHLKEEKEDTNKRLEKLETLLNNNQ